MPLLGKKVFTLASNAVNGENEDAPYLIPHTKERFQSKSEFKKRKDLYSQNIWTCRATGHTNLTHEEACKSEKQVMEQLALQFPKCFEKDLLELVHHSTESLDVLVDKTWLKLHQQFIIGEKVNLKVKVADKLIPAKVVALDVAGVDIKSSSTCNSPSSDKENNTDEKDKDKSKKWVPPKLLPYLYSIELENEAQVIHSVPGNDLQRTERVPSKDTLRHFIRVSALRAGTYATSPWAVNADLVKQYKLVNKFADFFLSPVKMSEAFKRAQENGKKRKLSNGTQSTAAKKLKLPKGDEKTKNDKVPTKPSSHKDSKDKSPHNSSPKKKNSVKKLVTSPKKKVENVISISDSDSEDKVSLAKLKRSSSAVDTDSDSDVPLYQLVEQTPPKKKKKGKEANAASDDDIPLSKITPSTPKKSATRTGNSSPQKTNSLTKNQKSNEKLASKKTNIAVKNKKKEKDLGKKGGMKQVTLYELTKRGKHDSKGGGNVTPQKKSTASTVKSPPKPPPMPPIVQRLLSCKRDTIYDKMKYSNLLKKAISILSPIHIKNLPEKLRDEFEQKKRFMEEKEKMAKMSTEERENYLKEKREQAKKTQKQKMLQKLKDQRRRFEDTDLQLSPLPQAKLVPTPDGFPNTLFGDVVMVTEFINCYCGLLMPDSEYPIYTDALIKALVGGSSGFAYVSRVLTVLLHTLLQDHIAKPYSELGAKLSDITVTAYTSSELVRLCLCCEDEEDDAGVVPEEYISSLKDSEFYQLGVEQKLSLLRGLCSRVLATYSVQDYMEEQQRNANTLMKQKVTEMKQIAAMKKSEKQSTGGDKQGVSEDRLLKAPDKRSSKDDQTAQGHDTSPQLSSHDKDVDDTGDDCSWGSIVKRRRLLAAKAAAEKEKQEKERLAMREKEHQEEKQKEKLRKKQEEISAAISLARMVLRQDPIGTDRHHDRYWVFTNVTPGLYVEKGWMNEEINYSVQKQTKDESEVELSSESEEEDTKNENSDLATHKSVYRARRHAIETSFPRPGQNLWFTYRSQKDLDGLLKSLHPQGIRESWLKAEIKKRYDDISRAIIQAQRTNLELRDSDGDTEMLAAFKKELSDMELRLRNGGLGGVPNFDKWEAELMEATDISVLGESLLKVKDGILDKFLQGFMKPMTKSSDATDDIKEEDSEESKKHEGGEKEKPHEKEDKTEKAVREWKEEVERCQTMSRLHVLMALLDSCVKWEKSAENAKCKICRKKCNDAQLLLCDECNQAFHMYCLRPALTKLPNGDWFCPACKPRKPEMRSLESDSEEEEKEDACRECGGSDKLIVCSKCPAAFHTQCHDPPLRHPPRGVWECSDCKSGVNSRRRGKFSRKAAPKVNYGKEVSSEEEEEEADDDDDAEESDEDYKVQYLYPKSSRSQKQKEAGRSREKQQHGSATKSGRKPRSRTSSQKNNSVVAVSTPTRVSRRGPSELSLCEDILHKVMKHKASWPFLEPVDKKLVPDYYTFIKKPMDFQTMLKKCTRLSYASPQEFIEDAALVFENAEAYNKTDSEVYTCMQEVEKLFKEALHKLLPDWPYYRTVTDRDESSSGSETGRRRSRNK